MAKYRAIEQCRTVSNSRLKDCENAQLNTLVYYQLHLEKPIYFGIYCNVTYLSQERCDPLRNIAKYHSSNRWHYT